MGSAIAGSGAIPGPLCCVWAAGWLGRTSPAVSELRLQRSMSSQASKTAVGRVAVAMYPDFTTVGPVGKKRFHLPGHYVLCPMFPLVPVTPPVILPQVLPDFSRRSLVFAKIGGSGSPPGLLRACYG